MRRSLAMIVVLASSGLVAACGGSSGSGASPSLTAALSYFPAGTPLVATVDTATKHNAAQLAGTGPDAAAEKAAFFSELARLGVDWNRDVKPLLGSPVALGIGASQTSGNATPFLAAWQTRSSTALAHLAADLHGVRKTGTHDGATLYTLGGAAFAISGATLVVSQNASNLTTALDRHQAGSGFSAERYAADTTGLPSGDVSVVGDLGAALSTPSAARARRVPWVSAIRDYGLTLSGTAHSVALHFRLDTNGRSLSANQLPIAQGAQAPALALGGGVPIAAGLRDPAQIYTFVLAAMRAADPAGYVKLQRQAKSAQQRTGVDVDAFVRSLTGDVQISSNGTTTVGRLPASAATAASWEKLLAHPGDGSTSTPLGGGFYRVTQTDGTTLTGGAVGNTLLLGRATPSQERAFARAGATPSHGSGAIAFRIAVGALVKRAIADNLSPDTSTTADPLATALASMLGNLTGSVQATPQALTGSATLALHPPGS